MNRNPVRLRALLARCVLAVVPVALTLGCQHLEETPDTVTNTEETALTVDPRLEIEDLGDASAETLAQLRAQTGVEITADSPEAIGAEEIYALRKVTTTPGDLPRLKVTLDGEEAELPLRHTHVRATVSGGVAHVEVEQTYVNPFASAIETTYVFPLPENSAVDAMRMEIGERIIEAEIKKREEAKQIYEEAKDAGHTAALLEQERPNVFTQSVANIAARSEIKVVIGYAQDLTYDAGEYEFVFPTVVGPRYIPGEQVGDDWIPDTGEVPDFERITPPVVGAGMRTGHDISIELLVDSGFPVADIVAPTHEVAIEEAEQGFELVLAEKASIPNRDFVVRWATAGDAPAASVLAHKGPADDTGYFTLTIQPPKLDLDEAVGKRELVFVVDVSGSMSGLPLALCKQSMRLMLRNLRPHDTFNVMRFESSNASVFERARPATNDNIREAIEFVNAMSAGGGTELGSAVETALTGDIEDGRNRYVFFMTDAQIGNEQTILEKTSTLVNSYAQAGKTARVFALGAGHHPNQALIERMVEAGDGAAIYATTEDDPLRAVNRYLGIIDQPIIENLRIDWGGLDVDGVSPQALPDLFASRPLMVHARYTEAGPRTITVKGEVDGEPLELVVDADLPALDDAHASQRTLWARAQIDVQERKLWAAGYGSDTEAVAAITDLGLEFGLVTAYTSFVAVDRSQVVSDGDPTTIEQPTEPKGGEDMQALLGSGATAQGYDATAGNYGLGTSGVGRGGGGTSTGGFGVGSFGTAGRGGGSAYGKGEGKLGDRSIAKPKLKPARAEVMGSLDKRIIRKVVNQNKSAVKACYESALASDDSLAGKIVVKWTIDSTGAVTSVEIKTDGLADPSVGECLEKEIATWRFPSPGGDGVITVSYPFVFSTE